MLQNNFLPLNTSLPTELKKYSPIPLIHELTVVYIILHHAISDFPKLEKYSLGAGIEKTLLDCVRQSFFATVFPPGTEKFKAIAMSSALFDTLKLNIRIAIDIHCLDEKIYTKLLPHFGEIGKMLGGWLKDAQKLFVEKTKTNGQNQNQT